MEFNIRLMFITSVILFVIIKQGYGIKCWDCRSDADPKCSDPFDNTTFAITDCSKSLPLEHLPHIDSTMCRKIRQKINGVWRYIRSCAYLGQPGLRGDERFCLMRTGTYNIFMEYCTCDSKDGCNAAGTLKVSSVLLGASTFLLILLLRNV